MVREQVVVVVVIAAVEEEEVVVVEGEEEEEEGEEKEQRGERTTCALSIYRLMSICSVYEIRFVANRESISVRHARNILRTVVPIARYSDA